MPLQWRCRSLISQTSAGESTPAKAHFGGASRTMQSSRLSGDDIERGHRTLSKDIAIASSENVGTAFAKPLDTDEKNLSISKSAGEFPQK